MFAAMPRYVFAALRELCLRQDLQHQRRMQFHPTFRSADLKITAIRTYPVEPRWLFIKIETDTDYYGWGECLGDKAYVVAEAVRSYEGSLIGQDPGKIVHHWQSLFRGAF